MVTDLIIQVALPTPLRRLFDYRLPAGSSAADYPVGSRVRIPFGRSQRIGLIIGHGSSGGDYQLREAGPCLDPEPLLPEGHLTFLRWAAHYYLHPEGDALWQALPVALRDGQPAERPLPRQWQLVVASSGEPPAELQRAKRQLALWQQLAHHGGQSESALREAGFGPEQWQPLASRGLIVATELAAPTLSGSGDQPPLPLTPAQQQAVAAIHQALGRFQPLLIEGVTGSGKTEVYLQALAPVLAAGQQVLVLVPEIGLTPQMVARFTRRFAVAVALLHSGLSDGERLAAWQQARNGTARIIIGTRSALFTPLPQLGLIIVDEEHDSSYKQQEGYRYHARDLALVRAKRLNIPVVLGSATPALESLANAEAGRYQLLRLPERAAGHAIRPQLLDIRARPLQQGLAPELIALIHRHLAGGGQVLLFLNRRGYAPALICHECGWVAPCQRCSRHPTVHRRRGALHCHHCDTPQPLPAQCPECGSLHLMARGLGTEQLDEALEQLFPGVSRVRVDRDSTRRKGELDAVLADILANRYQLLIGTQMLAKGHHFPDVSLVAVVDADGALFAADFRAAERLAQLLVQVAGHAGRAERPGQVVVQTHQPDHPLLQQVVRGGYPAFAAAALSERREALLPPFGQLLLLRAEAHQPEDALAFLERLRSQLQPRLQAAGAALLGPMPAPLERRAGRSRFQLLLEAPTRGILHQALQPLLAEVEGWAESRRVRWAVDVDPLDLD